MILISYFNSGNPVYAVAENKNINILIGCIIRDFINGEFDPLTISGKKITLTETDVQMSEYQIKNIVKYDDPLEEMKEAAKDYEKGFFFDPYSIYDEDYNVLKEEDYKISTCKGCGKIATAQEMCGEFCIDCFITTGVQKIFEECLSRTEENYTEYETLSKVYDTCERFTQKIHKYFIRSEKIAQKAKRVINVYVKKENVPQKYADKILGGMAA